MNMDSLDIELRLLSSTGNASLEAAVTWIENNEDKPDIDEMPLVQHFYLLICLIVVICALLHKL